jgi:putative phage-type endonuclease
MITAEQRQLRRRYIGSSDAPAIMGLDPYRSASDVYLEKTGQVEDFEGNEHTERGNLLEPVLIEWAERKLGNVIYRDTMLQSKCGVLCCNFDGLVGNGHPVEESVEAKSAVNADEWGDEGTDQIPERHIIQIHHGFAVLPSLKVCWVPVLLPGYKSLDFRLYKVDRNDELADAVADTCRQFMREHVAKLIPPSDFRPSIEVLKRMRRLPSKVIPVSADLAAKYIQARDAVKDAEKAKLEAEKSLLAALADAEGGEWDGGSLTYMEIKRKGYTVDDTTYRQLRIKVAKEK